jgi:hypothetical protein
MEGSEVMEENEGRKRSDGRQRRKEAKEGDIFLPKDRGGAYRHRRMSRLLTEEEDEGMKEGRKEGR